MFDILDKSSVTTDVLNLKYADTNGNGGLETYQNWINTFATPFSSVTDPTDHDITIFQAINERAHSGNTPTAKQNNYPQDIEIVASTDTLTNGDQVVFRVYLGDAANALADVHHIAFVAEGEFGDYYQPSINVLNSHLSEGSSAKLVDYPFLHPDFNGVDNDSLRWYVSLSRPADLSYGADFAGEEVCNLTCHISLAGLQGALPSGKNKLQLDEVYPVTFKIPEAGIMLANGQVRYVESNTVTLYVRPNPTLNAQVFLEGAYAPTEDLMRDDLRLSGLIPATEPYSALGYNFPNNEVSGLQMTDSSAVLSVTGQEAIVDWVVIELRDKNDPALLVSARPALLTREGKLVEVDGVAAPRLWFTPNDEYYLTIRHRNHIAAMTAQPLALFDNSLVIDFTQAAAYQNGTKLLSNGKYVFYTGDTNGDGLIDALDRSNVWNDRNQTGYNRTDCTLDGLINASDRSIIWNNRNTVSTAP